MSHSERFENYPTPGMKKYVVAFATKRGVLGTLAYVVPTITVVMFMVGLALWSERIIWMGAVWAAASVLCIAMNSVKNGY